MALAYTLIYENERKEILQLLNVRDRYRDDYTYIFNSKKGINGYVFSQIKKPSS